MWITNHGLLIVLATLQLVSASGVFELRLKSFINDYGKDAVGQCCSGETGAETCTAPCRTRFRVCLKHYQARVDTTSPCTFGDIVTPVLGDNSLQMDALQPTDGFSNPIRFPFDFTWPVSKTPLVCNTPNGMAFYFPLVCVRLLQQPASSERQQLLM
ncbi:hypothetical protein FOCC_FOCC014574, partial [Frankliniella occidentalis]